MAFIYSVNIKFEKDIIQIKSSLRLFSMNNLMLIPMNKYSGWHKENF